MLPKPNTTYFQFSWSDRLEKVNDFDWLINWLSGEFILHQQEVN